MSKSLRNFTLLNLAALLLVVIIGLPTTPLPVSAGDQPIVPPIRDTISDTTTQTESELDGSVQSDVSIETYMEIILLTITI